MKIIKMNDIFVVVNFVNFTILFSIIE